MVLDLACNNQTCVTDITHYFKHLSFVHIRNIKNSLLKSMIAITMTIPLIYVLLGAKFWPFPETSTLLPVKFISICTNSSTFNVINPTRLQTLRE